ncbi:MAG: serpin family protein [Planctomycetota bacterium]|nr:serpin family protein [Planctomycetota bacterium]
MLRAHWSALLFLSFAVTFLVGCSSSDPAVEEENEPPFVATPEDIANSKAVAKSSNEFAVSLYQKLAANKSENLFFSPYSISSSLALISAGAEGETLAQMRSVLHLGMPEGESLSGFHALAGLLRKDEQDGFTLNIANRIWTQRGLNLLPPFLKLVTANSTEGISEVDFTADPAAAAKTIDAWITKETHGKITGLLGPEAFNENTRLVLTNAVYFKAKWAEEFKPRNTQPAPFHRSPDREVQVPTMRQFGERHIYAKTPDLEILDLPYSSGTASMVILLPSKRDGLAAVERQLSAESIDKWLASADYLPVNVFLPKFTFTSTFELNGVLSSLGMSQAFDLRKADFSRTSTEEPLFISAVAHKAFVDVNEEGTEAAAAIVVTESKKEVDSRPTEFRADHPFLFLIRDRESGAILFLGRVTDPTGGAKSE